MSLFKYLSFDLKNLGKKEEDNWDSHTAAWGINERNHLRKRFGSFLWSWTSLITRPRESTPRYTPETNEDIRPHEDLYTSVHGARMHHGPNWKRPKYQLTGQLRNTLWKEYFSAATESKLRGRVTTWVDLENILLSKSQTRSTTRYRTLCMLNSGKAKLIYRHIVMERRWAVSSCWGRGAGSDWN